MKIKTLEVAGLEQAIYSQRNPMNSWSKSDSFGYIDNVYNIRENDMKLAQSLIKAGSEHRKYRRMIQVWADFDMPRYWWSEFDTYKIGTTANSCSTMHRLLNNDNPITLDLFVTCDEDLDIEIMVVNRIEELRKEYKYQNHNSDYKNRLLVRAKRLLMEGFLQLRTVNLNYETIANAYHQRKPHRLKEEWTDTFCTWVESLPYAEELILYTGKTNE